MRKKLSGFQGQKKMAVNDLVKKLTEQDEKNISRGIEKILNSRKKKLRQIRKLHYSQITQDAFKPSKSIEVFSEDKPISTGLKFLNEKDRRNLITPNRAFNSQSNIKSGQINSKMLENYYSNEDKRVMGKKFEEYVRVVSESTGSVKKKTLEQKSQKKQYVPPIKIKMKKTFFRKYASDRFNFYQPPIKQITRIFDLTSVSDQKRLTDSRKLTHKYSTIDTSKISTLNSDRNTIQRLNSEALQIL